MVNRRITSSLQYQGLSNRTSQVLNGRGCSSFSHFAILFLWQESSEGQLTLLGDVRLENKTLQVAFLGRLKKKKVRADALEDPETFERLSYLLFFKPLEFSP